MDFSQLLVEKTDIITESWVEAVYLDRQISSANNLPSSAIQNHLHEILRAMVSVLSHDEASNIDTIVKENLFPVTLRAAQGFVPTEIVREYRLLRQVIFSTLEPDLLKGKVPQVIRAYNVINATIEQAIFQCCKIYVDERFQELQGLQNHVELTNQQVQELSCLVKAHQYNLCQLAHELKNSLSVIIGYAELFLRSHNRDTQRRDSVANLEYVERVIQHGRQVLYLINDALDIACYSSGKIKLSLEPTDVRSLINNIVELWEPLANEKQLQVVKNCDRAPETVLTAPLRLQQIITNLLINAIRYTNSGVINLTCQKLGDSDWCIEVMDTGIGIAPEDQVHIFEPFYQAKNSGSSWSNGSGLGLAIVWQLVKLMQGKIELVSQVGAGSTFTVTLPLETKLTETLP
ncbi:ATP-binding protein [Floridanema aerugineum]|uniref:histidine kinase n=1 Tax=Floridaenema aerugineum BLCC-F46 TaxID=3153654 RepID=A0ABV4X697_9CYAN